MTFEFIGKPQDEEHYPERYKAVLLVNDGLSKMLPHESETTVDEFLEDCKQLAKDYGEELVIK